MMQLSRRQFIKAAGACSVALTLGSPSLPAFARSKGRVIVVGGGYGGAIAAKYLNMADPDIDVLLIEKDAPFVSCPMSNEVLSGERDLASLSFDYRTLSQRRGVDVVQDEVVAIDPDKHYVKGASGKVYRYAKLVVSPGVAFRYDKIAGYSPEVAKRIPHAWEAGPQTTLLRSQLEGMKDGGVCCIVAPPNPFRCPPGPYERAAQIAMYFKRHKPKSKILILDAKDRFSKQGLFMQAYKKFYGDMVEWVSGASGGIIEAVKPDAMTLVGQVEEFRGDVINIIPPQKAGQIAQTAGLADDSGWCPVDQSTFESTIHKDIHVIGDACIAGVMPKSGYAANSQGKVAAAAIAAVMNGRTPPPPSYVNTCYSIAGPEWGFSVAGVYELKDGKIQSVPGAGGLSPLEASAHTRAVEAEYAHSWFRNITADMFG
jgi:sulfide dehydrogenase [flavocytochrome c] flavoprotein chain